MPDIEDVILVLNNHGTPYCTLNRLWLKHHKSVERRRRDPDRYSDSMILSAPELNKNNTQISLESRSTDDLYKLAGSGTRDSPFKDDTPVIIVRFRGEDYLIDGGSRSRKWHKERNRDMHPAYVVTVIE